MSWRMQLTSGSYCLIIQVTFVLMLRPIPHHLQQGDTLQPAPVHFHLWQAVLQTEHREITVGIHQHGEGQVQVRGIRVWRVLAEFIPGQQPWSIFQESFGSSSCQHLQEHQPYPKIKSIGFEVTVLKQRRGGCVRCLPVLQQGHPINLNRQGGSLVQGGPEPNSSWGSGISAVLAPGLIIILKQPAQHNDLRLWEHQLMSCAYPLQQTERFIQ